MLCYEIYSNSIHLARPEWSINIATSICRVDSIPIPHLHPTHTHTTHPSIFCPSDLRHSSLSKLIEVELELERRSMLEVMEWILAVEAAALIRLRIQWIHTHVELFPLLRIGKHLLGGRHIDELLLGHFLLIALISVRMPFLGHFAICFYDLLLGRRPRHTQNLIIISTFGLLLPRLHILDAFFGPLQVLVDLKRRLIIVNGCN